jgi:pyruvate,water dikinase
MEYILWLDQLSREDLLIAGGKGANLGEMIKLKLPVPQGFVITAKAFDKFLEANKIKGQINELIKKCDVENTSQLLETSKKIKDLIVAQEIPHLIKSEIIEAYKSLSYTDQVVSEEILKLIAVGRELAIVAVRSSATTEDLPTASFAGQQASFLNVRGQKELLDSIKKCWASLYEPRAIFYRAKHGFGRASIAVIVQRMVNSEKSGVIFTINPATGEDHVVIEATFGLGETLVSGAVQPDNYIVSKDLKILEKKIGKKERMRVRDYASNRTIEISVPRAQVNQQVLTDEEILKLAKYALLLEKHYGKPQDIEFAIELNRIYIVQTRAVTTEAKVEEIKIEAEPILKGLGVSPGIATGKVKIVHGLEDIAKVEKGDILVTEMTSPDIVPTMSKSAAIITDLGSSTCHAAIVSREMGIPCIVATQTATKYLHDGQLITVDAYHGLIYPGVIEVKKPTEAEVPVEAKTATQLKVNLAFPEGVEKIAPRVDGVGLLRIEHMITKSGVHPAKLIKEGKKEEYIQILLNGIGPIAKTFYPKPVWVRSLDARSDEFRNLRGGEEEPQEPNPMLGWHGIRRSLDEPEILEAEFEAIKRLHEEGFDNVHIMLPFIISVEEFKKAKEIAEQIGLPKSVKLGIMVEVPSAALTIEDFCKEGIDFASIGSNDLTQTTLGVDRNNAKISSLFDETHPAMLKLMEDVIKTCNRYKIESSICGELPSNKPEVVKFLIKCGITSISVNVDAIEKVRKAIFQAERELLSELIKERKS